MNDNLQRPFFQGFFGAPNFGDELLCRAVVELFDPRGNGFVATRNNRVTHTTLRDTKTRVQKGKFPHLGFWTGLPLRLHRLRRSTQLIIGGGGVIQDVFSPATIMSSVFDTTRAVSGGYAFAYVGIEIGNISSSRSLRRTKFAMRNAAAIWCRDKQSLDLATAYGAGDRAFLAPDLAHSFLRSWHERHARPIDPTHCVINVRLLARDNPETFVALIHYLCEAFARVTLASAQPGEERGWLKLIPNPPANLIVHNSGLWEDTLTQMRDASLVIAERYHYIAAAAHMGAAIVPVLGTHKARSLVQDLQLPIASRVPIENASLEQVLRAISSAQHVNPGVLDRLASEVRAATERAHAAVASAKDYSRPTQREARRVGQSILFEGVGQLFNSAQSRVARRFRRR